MIKSQVASKYGLVFPGEFDCRYCGCHVDGTALAERWAKLL